MNTTHSITARERDAHSIIPLREPIVSDGVAEPTTRVMQALIVCLIWEYTLNHNPNYCEEYC